MSEKAKINLSLDTDLLIALQVFSMTEEVSLEALIESILEEFISLYEFLIEYEEVKEKRALKQEKGSRGDK